MPNRNTHLVVAGAAGVITGIIAESKLNPGQENLGRVAVYTGSTTVGGIMPDILEPATHPNHRAFFHSFALGIFLGWLGVKIWKAIKETKQTEKTQSDPDVNIAEVIGLVAVFFIVGFIVHLILDGFTAKGLPKI